MKHILILLILTVSFLVAACGKDSTPAATETPTFTATPDLCSSGNLPAEASKVNDLMRAFDDYSALASNTPQAQLVQVILPMQKVLRDAEDQKVPACLVSLKKLQLSHMNAVIQTLIVLLGNPKPNQDVIKAINTGIQQARELHRQYDLELARLLGITLAAPPASTALPGTPGASITNTPAILTVTNLGATGVILLASPDANVGRVATLDPGLTALALGQTADGKWIQVDVPGQPGQKAWVDATLVKTSGTLPVVTP